jgi:hypothetical protein
VNVEALQNTLSSLQEEKLNLENRLKDPKMSRAAAEDI